MEEYQQVTNEPIRSDEIYANVMQDDRVKNVISQTSPDNLLTDIEWRIRGYKKNNYTGTWEKVDEKAPEPSFILISRYITHLASFLNDNTRFTNLSSEEINRIMASMVEWLTDDLRTHAKEYGLEHDYTERTRIGNILLGNTFLVLKRAENGMEARRVWSAINLGESFSYSPQKKGFFSNLKDIITGGNR